MSPAKITGPGKREPVTHPLTLRPLTLPLTVRVDRHPVHIPHLPGYELWEHYESNNWAELLPGRLARADQRWLWQRVVDRDDRFDIPDLARVARGVMGALVGVPWWVMFRIAASTARERFSFAAWCAAKGMDVYDLPVHRIGAAAYMFILDGTDSTEEALNKVEHTIWTPPKTGPRVTRWTREQEAATFTAAMAALARS